MASRAVHGFRAFVIFLFAAACIGAVVLWLVGWDDPLAARSNPETEDAYADGEVTPLAAREEGYLKRLDVDDNQPVCAGQVIAELEDDDYKAAVAQAEGQLQAAEAALRQLQDQQRVLLLQVQQAGTQAQGTHAEQVRAAEEAYRQAALLPTALGLRRQYDDAVAENRRLAAENRADDATTQERRRQLDVLAAQQARAAADIEQQQAQLDLARIRLGYTTLRAPADGIVVAVHPGIGSMVEEGAELITFVPPATS